MGVSVTLDILPQGIDADAWATTYDETLRVLAEHPAELMGMGWKGVNGARVEVYTRSIERCQGDRTRRGWCVAGDRASLRMGEPQTMFRDLERYPAAARGEAPDVLFLLDTECCRGPVRVFGGQTHGAPYHVALLAAAMVVESRFPRRAVVGGDIDRGQALEARQWAERVLGRPVALPVRVEPKVLAGRLAEHHGGDALAQAFDRLYIDETHRKPIVLLQTFDRELSETWVLAKLGAFRPTALGAIRVMVAWLDATGDLARLCQLACQDDRGPGYPPAEFVEALADTWVGLPASVTAGLEPCPRSNGWSHAVDDKLLASLFDMQIPGRHLATRLDLEHIGGALDEVFGAAGARLFEVFRERTTALAAYIDSVRDRREGGEPRGPRAMEDASEIPLDLKSPDDLTSTQVEGLRRQIGRAHV